MMPRITIILAIVLSLMLALTITDQAFAVEDPLRLPNNKIGIHILFDSEIQQAAKLVNSSGGDWGYVTIPIQSGDKDLTKWQHFMDEAKLYHVIPIIRIATEGDYFNKSAWRKPEPKDIVDYANFLDSLNWPVKNRYVIIFNEVNRGDEWGGSLNPHEYAELLSYAVTVFKSKSQNFFIISSGMDNAAPNQGSLFMNQYTYLYEMNRAVPGIFNQVDGLSSHSYPNPGFSQPPNTSSTMGVASFQFEKNLVNQLANRNLPIFITETGWSSTAVSDDSIASFYDTALKSIWNDSNVVAVTPFLLQSFAGPFKQFSLIKDNNQPTKQYQFIYNLPKIKGMPTKETNVLSASTKRSINRYLYKLSFKPVKRAAAIPPLSQNALVVFKWLLKL